MSAGSSTNLVIGAGAVGSILACHMAKARRKVKLVVRETDLAAMQELQTLRVDRIRGGPPLEVMAPGLTTAIHLDEEVENVFICVKYPDLPTILDRLPAHIPDHVTLLPCLNGISATRQLRERYPDARIAPVTIMFNGQLLEPLHAQITTKAQILIRSDDNSHIELFGKTGMDVQRAEDESVAWGKLLINLNNAVCALTHTTFRDLLTNNAMTRNFVAVLDEAVAVMEAEELSYKLPVPMPYRPYRWLLLHGGKLPWWFAKIKNGLTEASYPSMVADIQRGRPTEVEQLNGEIVHLGERAGIPTPVNRKVVELIRRIEGDENAKPMTPDELWAELSSVQQ